MRKNLIRGALVLTAILALSACISKGMKNKTPTRDALVMTTEPRKFPGIVRLLTEDGNFFCSGAVISDTEVLTAAHCLNQFTINNLVMSAPIRGKFLQVKGVATMFNPRSDTAIITGDFRQFSKLKYNTNPEADILVNDYDLAACGFPYAGQLVCYRLQNPFKMVDIIGAIGQLYAGMSGGPVIDMSTGTIYAVNHAVTEQFILIAPIINLRESLFPVPVK